jgi:hypothetical protein
MLFDDKNRGDDFRDENLLSDDSTDGDMFQNGGDSKETPQEEDEDDDSNDIALFYEEIVVLLSRLRLHKTALSILIRDVGDFSAAENYCVAHYDRRGGGLISGM